MSSKRKRWTSLWWHAFVSMTIARSRIRYYYLLHFMYVYKCIICLLVVKRLCISYDDAVRVFVSSRPESLHRSFTLWPRAFPSVLFADQIRPGPARYHVVAEPICSPLTSLSMFSPVFTSSLYSTPSEVCLTTISSIVASSISLSPSLYSVIELLLSLNCSDPNKYRPQNLPR